MNNFFYFYKGQKIPLNKSARYKAVGLNQQASAASGMNAHSAIAAASSIAGIQLQNGMTLINVQEEAMPAAFGTVTPMGGSMSGGLKEYHVFESGGNEKLVLQDELLIRFKIKPSPEDLAAFLNENRLELITGYEWDDKLYLCRVIDYSSFMMLLEALQNNSLIDYATPNFLRIQAKLSVPNDQLFARQWALKNTGQGGGAEGNDIKALDAWSVTTGNAGITIAIIDEGVDYTHEDLNVPGKLVTGYDALTMTDNPAPEGDDAHGTACAGIAAAAGNNSKGICGVAPGCRIMGIRIAKGLPDHTWQTTDIAIADGISKAVARGADVLSNSWGGGAPSVQVTNAILHAKNKGRSGKGCVVCFAAGNENHAVSYPATMPEVIAVAACNEWGKRKSPTSNDGENWWGSNFGPQIMVAAPGVHITTTDISGSHGYGNGNYVFTFNGTSAATPHVAGVAALVLSVNPGLKATEVEALLKKSTDDLGAPGHNIFTGFGRINAFKAVNNAIVQPNIIAVRFTVILTDDDKDTEEELQLTVSQNGQVLGKAGFGRGKKWRDPGTYPCIVNITPTPLNLLNEMRIRMLKTPQGSGTGRGMEGRIECDIICDGSVSSRWFSIPERRYGDNNPYDVIFPN